MTSTTRPPPPACAGRPAARRDGLGAHRDMTSGVAGPAQAAGRRRTSRCPSSAGRCGRPPPTTTMDPTRTASTSGCGTPTTPTSPAASRCSPRPTVSSRPSSSTARTRTRSTSTTATGWTTQHKHLESLPPLVDRPARRPGRADRPRRRHRHPAGRLPPALHAARRRRRVRVRFNGTLIDTHRGRRRHGASGRRAPASSSTSNNCPGRAFLPFDQGGQHHVYAYEAARGAAGIASIANDGSGVVNPWGITSGSRRLTHFVPFQTGSEARYISYASSTVRWSSGGSARPARRSSRAAPGARAGRTSCPSRSAASRTTSPTTR